MRFPLHAVISCCVFATVLLLPVDRGAPPASSSSLKQRFDSLLQDKDTKAAVPLSSSGLKSRQKRAGCLLVTCAYNDLLHRLLLITNREIDTKAPQAKINATGYGRRRRHTPQDGAEGELESSGTEQGGAAAAAAGQRCRVRRSCTAA